MNALKKIRFNIFPQKTKAATLLEEQRSTEMAPSEQTEIIHDEEPTITANNLPEALVAHFEQLSLLEKKIKAADEHAQSARSMANDAKEKSSIYFGRGKILEALQNSVFHIAQAQGDIMDTMKVSFGYQKRISELINQMLRLCVSNLASTRNLLSQLRTELKKAEGGNYSEETKNEMSRIIRELKAQEDMMCKQAHQSAMLQEQAVHIHKQDEHLLQHDARHEETASEVERVGRLAGDNQKNIMELEQRLSRSEAMRLESEKKMHIILIAAVVVVVALTLVQFFM